ncbi:G-protein coupled receptor 4-like [Lampris incognitus]|uniref:G-protein coupled receptor 4-like n=1 Tax=Lampris incognitus TaxID=2546036 RepID=UPI0024B5C5C4|nr:G-protein coupled receptor 4-like [Lampris incognitus]
MDFNTSLSQANGNLSNSCAREDFAGKDSVDQHMYPTAYSLFFIVGFPANCLSLYVACVLMRKGNNLAVYLVNLSISDLLYTISLPVWMELALHRPVGDVVCSSVAVIMYNSFYVGSGLLCCISCDRYLAVVYPLRFNRVRETRTAVIVSMVVWCVEMVVHIILLYHTGELQDFSSRRMCEEKTPMTQAYANKALIRVVFGFLVPLIIMTFCFQQIMQSLGQSLSILAVERRKVRLLLMLLLVTYLLAFVPYQTVMLLRALMEPSGDCYWARTLRDPYIVLVATTTLNSMLDPIIYCLVSESAQTEIRNALEKCKRVLWIKRYRNTFPRVNSVS